MRRVVFGALALLSTVGFAYAFGLFQPKADRTLAGASEELFLEYDDDEEGEEEAGEDDSTNSHGDAPSDGEQADSQASDGS